ncbi:hypothetical protein AGMMS49543_22790 [Betaproteobacteria bacterium]|nr:hypothetical protein AGMMS49543_22790 [Betaproteobacteria bacterium]GHU20262.1 hypothetical protein AGMMS50243_14370 [Betaproteobacteria bacterium]
MTVTTCKACHKKVSLSVSACPHCGCKNPTTGFSKSKTVGVFAMLVIMTFAMSFYAVHNKINKNEVSVPQTPGLTSPAPVRRLNMTPEAFQQALHAELKRTTTQLAVERGEFNGAFMITMEDGITMVGTVNKNDGSIKGLALTVPAKNDGITPLIILLSTAYAITPDVPKEEINLAMTEMIKEATDGTGKGIPVERTVGPLKYAASADSTTGLRFSFAPR